MRYLRLTDEDITAHVVDALLVTCRHGHHPAIVIRTDRGTDVQVFACSGNYWAREQGEVDSDRRRMHLLTRESTGPRVVAHVVELALGEFENDSRIPILTRPELYGA